MIEVFLLSIGLAMDAFAVSIGIGSKMTTISLKERLQVAGYFGGFQAIMPLIGFLAGTGMAGWIGEWDHWIAFLLLLLIGGKMIYEAFHEGVVEALCGLSHRMLFTLAIATSIDALAAGFTLPLLDAPAWLSVSTIGVITFALSYAGIGLGRKMGTYLEDKAELLGGVILIGIGSKILLEHTGII